MEQFKRTKGKWKAVNNGPHWNNKAIDNWEIHWSEDGECVVDHVYDQYDALLISKAPEMLEMLESISDRNEGSTEFLKSVRDLIKEATEL